MHEVDLLSRLDQAVLAERTAVIERHLHRVAKHLPDNPDEFEPFTDASDTVILHLWQAIQAVIGLAASACIHFRLGTPESYGESLQELRTAGFLVPGLVTRLTRVEGFYTAVLHADEFDMGRVYRAAREGPADLRAFLKALAERIQ
jgi:uncharacterized protein YutE (UPF0331/DUF86 family)